MNLKIHALTGRDIKFQAYFTALAPRFRHLTSNTTKLMALVALAIAKISSSPRVTVHDNACGPGTETVAIIEYFEVSSFAVPHICATAYTLAMIKAMSQVKGISGNEAIWAETEASKEDSQALTFEANNKLDFSICSVSIANLDQPHLALQERSCS